MINSTDHRSISGSGAPDLEISHPPEEQFPGTVKVAIGQMSDADIALMSPQDLVDLVRFSGMESACRGGMEHLQFMERVELKRLACLARRGCREQVNWFHSTAGCALPVRK